MRLDGAKKSQDACQDLISWEDAGPAMMDLGLLLSSFVFRACRELAHPQPSLGRRLGGFLPKKGHGEGAPSALGHPGPSRLV